MTDNQCPICGKNCEHLSPGQYLKSDSCIDPPSRENIHALDTPPSETGKTTVEQIFMDMVAEEGGDGLPIKWNLNGVLGDDEPSDILGIPWMTELRSLIRAEIEAFKAQEEETKECKFCHMDYDSSNFYTCPCCDTESCCDCGGRCGCDIGDEWSE